MAIEVPAAPKVYTTKYTNFRGVDYTNDPSNVWHRRSPDGLNMLPDIDGRPYKRTGWDIDISAADFKSIAGTPVAPVADRLYYFELGGYDYIAVFNSLGLFIITTVGNPNVPFSQITTNNPSTINGNVVTFHNTFVPLTGPTASVASFDANRAFFFEGGGEAGFYVFCRYAVATDTYKQTLIRFTADSPYFHEVSPRVPKVLIACDQYGAGTLYEPVNMLSEKRTICYLNDVSGVTRFYLPSGEQYLTVHKVEKRQTNGDWVTVPTTDYTLDTVNFEYIEFTSQPAHIVDGEDNLRVTYTPVGSAGTIGKRSAYTIGTLTIKQYTSYRQRCVSPTDVERGLETPVTTRTFQTRYEKPTTTLTSKDVVHATSTFKVYVGGSWVTLNYNEYQFSYTAYNNTVQITPTEAYFNNHSRSASISRTTTDWVSGGLHEYEGEERGYYYRTVADTYTVSLSLSHNFTQYYATSGTLGTSPSREAFWGCSKAMIFGNGLINQVFLTATNATNFSTRVWYSGATDPTYFADDNYIEVGASDKPIMGLLKIGQYLGIVKGGNSSNESIYLAYPTSYEDITTYAVKQSIAGIGAVSKGAFNILNTEPLFLSAEGVMGVDETQSEDRKVRNRSYFVNKRLCAEQGLETAVSFVFDGMYYLSVNGHCYVLDGAQKSSWANEKTNMQYECYYLDNVPAQCFAKYRNSLWFSDFNGNLCRFKNSNDARPYCDAYSVGEPTWTAQAYPVNSAYAKSALSGDKDTFEVSDTIAYNGSWYTITEVGDTTVTVATGVPIRAIWSTLSDDDGAVNYFKSLQKKGSLVSLLPSSDSGVTVYIVKDEGRDNKILVGSTDERGHWLPSEYYVKKKVKKYKRLQFVLENNKIDQSFGIDEIIKMYTIGSFSKNKR